MCSNVLFILLPENIINILAINSLITYYVFQQNWIYQSRILKVVVICKTILYFSDIYYWVFSK